MNLVPITETHALKYVGNPDCRYVTPTLLGFLAVAASYVNNYNTLDETRLFVGNGQNLNCECSGNPAHIGYSVDVNYYTKNTTPPEIPNATHYREPGWENAQIWDGDVFLEDKFNFKANWDLFNILHNFGNKFGQFTYRTSDRIMLEFRQRGYDVTGMSGDFEFKYNHHLHAHIDLYGV